VVFASTYRFAGDPDPQVDMYGRWTNPTWSALEGSLGELEEGTAVSFASGMAAVAAVLCSVLRAGDTVVLPPDGYFGVRSFAETYLTRWGVNIRYATLSSADPPSLANTRLVWIETPTNPLLDVYDIDEIGRAAHDAGALLAVDNTSATVMNQKPLTLGADYSVSSDTKGTAGHSDLVAGHVATQDEGLANEIRQWRSASGSVPSPMDAWLLHRSLETLELRCERQSANALAAARFFEGHQAVTFVRYPGLPGDPAHPLACKQMRWFGGLISFALRDRDAAERFLEACGSIITATSFGGVHTTAERRGRWGLDEVPDGLIRLSVGCEAKEDVIASLEEGLVAAD